MEDESTVSIRISYLENNLLELEKDKKELEQRVRQLEIMTATLSTRLTIFQLIQGAYTSTIGVVAGVVSAFLNR